MLLYFGVPYDYLQTFTASFRALIYLPTLPNMDAKFKFNMTEEAHESFD